ncbi:hypothetical protein QE429_000854 [Bacillus sp. SORGH_AS 510]|uniref:hypothetical protein n=1 Tax=Bacillus sp. SORGH_AS_0510 TaxID=3041771 RepID=UPI002789887C|nr:hypothetical protein [Bacillus sp. SORGH_AS_0510]MDQ1144027.1 hypothetical protein [Bacillus sp. SORGH_AS_0510]
MKFDTKYLIRWGIPGWVFLLSIIFLYVVYHADKFLKVFSSDPIKLLSFVLAVASIGVPVGYIFHQLYFGVFWVMSKTKGVKSITKHINGYQRKFPNDVDEEYYHLEYLWQSELSLLEQTKRDYIAERYRHLLSTTHSLGVLGISMLSSFLVAIFILKKIDMGTDDTIAVLSILVLLVVLIFLNFLYYSEKTQAFQGMFLNEFINDKERNKGRKQQSN